MAATMVHVNLNKPPEGKTVAVTVEPRQTIFFDHVPEDFTWNREANALHVSYPDGSGFILRNFFTTDSVKDVYFVFPDSTVLAQDLINALAADLQTDASFDAVGRLHPGDANGAFCLFNPEHPGDNSHCEVPGETATGNGMTPDTAHGTGVFPDVLFYEYLGERPSYDVIHAIPPLPEKIPTASESVESFWSSRSGGGFSPGGPLKLSDLLITTPHTPLPALPEHEGETPDVSHAAAPIVPEFTSAPSHGDHSEFPLTLLLPDTL